MKEVKSPKKPLIYYYGIALLLVLLFNLVVAPFLTRAAVEEVDYGTFMKMTEDKNIGTVEIDDSEIVFTDKENKKIYKTGEMNDPDLTQRLYDSGQIHSQYRKEAFSGAQFSLNRASPDRYFHRNRAVHEQKADGKRRRTECNVIRSRKEQRKGVRSVNGRDPL